MMGGRIARNCIICRKAKHSHLSLKIIIMMRMMMTMMMIIITMMMMKIMTTAMIMKMMLVEMKKNRYDKNGDANEYYDVT